MALNVVTSGIGTIIITITSTVGIVVSTTNYWY